MHHLCECLATIIKACTLWQSQGTRIDASCIACHPFYFCTYCEAVRKLSCNTGKQGSIELTAWHVQDFKGAGAVALSVVCRYGICRCTASHRPTIESRRCRWGAASSEILQVLWCWPVSVRPEAKLLSPLLQYPIWAQLVDQINKNQDSWFLLL